MFWGRKSVFYFNHFAANQQSRQTHAGARPRNAKSPRYGPCLLSGLPIAETEDHRYLPIGFAVNNQLKDVDFLFGERRHNSNRKNRWLLMSHTTPRSPHDGFAMRGL